MRFLLGVVVTFAALAAGGVLYVYSGLFNTAATKSHTAIVEWGLHTAMHQSVKARAEDVQVPDNLVSEARVEQGARAYDQLCSACHLKPGQTSSLIRQGLNPTPPALTEQGHWGPAEQYWIIRNGIRMTGMPAWGKTHEEEDLWELTAFLQRLPTLSDAEYTALVQAAGPASADDGHDHDHGDMSSMAGENGESNAGHQGSSDDHHSESDPTEDHHADANDGNEAGHHGEETTGAQTEGVGESAAEDDHYADGHTH